MISTLISIIKVIPMLKGFFDSLVSAWVQSEISRMTQENRAAILKAVVAQDQRGLEELLSTRPGVATGLPGTHIVDHLPGVQ